MEQEIQPELIDARAAEVVAHILTYEDKSTEELIELFNNTLWLAAQNLVDYHSNDNIDLFELLRAAHQLLRERTGDKWQIQSLTEEIEKLQRGNSMLHSIAEGM